MKNHGKLLPALVTLVIFQAGTTWAETEHDFEDLNVGTPFTLEEFGASGPARIANSGGNPGKFLELTKASNGLQNFSVFDRSDIGSYRTSSFSFDFLIEPVDDIAGADGFSFSYADTSVFGLSGGIGSAPFSAEDPAVAGVLGVGFDTWSNADPFDFEVVGDLSDYWEISVFHDGNLIIRIDDTRTLSPSLQIDDGAWHSVDGSVNFITGTFDLQVDGNPVFSNLTIPGLVPFESRIMLGARTGGENELHGLDNIRVTWSNLHTRAVPALSPWGMIIIALILLAMGGMLISNRQAGKQRA